MADVDVRVIGHDPDALELFYRRHLGDVVAYLSGRCTNPHDVADLVAETFVQAIDSAGSYDPKRGRPVAWLIGIARNVFRHHARDRAARRRSELRVQGHRLLDTEDVSRIEEVIDAQRLALTLLGRLDHLSRREREVVELVDLSGLTPSEAAAALRISPSAARVALHRAHTRLTSTKGP